MAANILIDEMKGLVEGSARGDDAQVLIEHKDRVANGIDDGICERKFVLNIND